MDIPQPPEDAELRTIIDKLAQFVARNGPVFEEMTKKKQKGNPKFQFVYGGEYFNYYRYKVSSEQAIVKQQQHQPQPQQNLDNDLANNWSSQTVQVLPNPPQSNIEIEHILQQQDTLREQIKQSEQNLTAQHTVLLQQQQTTIEAVVAKCEATELHEIADESGISINELHGILQPIIDSCTKDSISNGKSWFLQHSDTQKKCFSVVQCLLYKVLRSSTFSQKLHVIYLVNDLLHHSARKNANDLKDALEVAVVPMFCNAHLMANEDEKVKLEKLLKLWESKANYLSASTLDKLHNPIESFQQYQSNQMAKFANEVAAVTQQTKTTFDSYQSQHQAFVCHAMQQIMDLQQQKQNLEQKQQQPPPASKRLVPPPTAVAAAAPPQPQPLLSSNNIIPLETIQATLQQTIQNLSQSNNTVSSCSSSNNNNNTNTSNSNIQQTVQQHQPFPTIQPANGDNTNSFIQMNPNVPPPHLAALQPAHNLSQIPTICSTNNLNPLPPHHIVDTQPQPSPQQQQQQPSNGMESQFTQPPPGYFPPPGMFPDFTKPPPGFPPPKSNDQYIDDLMPTAPYFDLPAGLMVPLVKLEDTEYKPLDPKDIRLPPPAPPSDRLLAAVDAFYSLPSHERPRDSEGWEKLGLYEYYRAKNLAKREKEEAILAGLREESKSPSPVSFKEEKENSPPKRRYCSKSPSPPTPSVPTHPLAPSHQQQQSQHHHHHSAKNSRNRRSRSRGSRSRSRSRSRSPSRRRSRLTREARENRRRRSYTRSRSRSRSPRKSVSPMKPSFNSGPNILRGDTQELDSSNKGHEMLRKMGWGGKGLGANEQGIDAPIQGGDVRDRQDQFKGVGCNLNDPYENFRKNKGAAFITRMKARAEEREKETKVDNDGPKKRG